MLRERAGAVLTTSGDSTSPHSANNSSPSGPTSFLKNQPPTFIDPYTQGVLFKQYELNEVENLLFYDFFSSLALTLHSYTGFQHFTRHLFLAAYPSITGIKDKEAETFNFTASKQNKRCNRHNLRSRWGYDGVALDKYLSSLERDVEYAQQYCIILGMHYQTFVHTVPVLPDLGSNSAFENANLLSTEPPVSSTPHTETKTTYTHNNMVLSPTIYKAVVLDDLLDDVQYSTQQYGLNVGQFFQQRSDEINNIISAILPCGFFAIRAWTHCESIRLTHEQLCHEFSILAAGTSSHTNATKLVKLNITIELYNERMNASLNDVYTWLFRNPVLLQLLETPATHFMSQYEQYHSNHPETKSIDPPTLDLDTTVQIIDDCDWDLNMVHGRTRSTVVDTVNPQSSSRTSQPSRSQNYSNRRTITEDEDDYSFIDGNGNEFTPATPLQEQDVDQFLASSSDASVAFQNPANLNNLDSIGEDHYPVDPPPPPPADIEKVFEVEYFPPLPVSQSANPPTLSPNIFERSPSTINIALHTAVLALQRELFILLTVLHRHWVYIDQLSLFQALSHQRVYDYLDVNEHFFDLLHLTDPYTNKTSAQNNSSVGYQLYTARLEALQRKGIHFSSRLPPRMGGSGNDDDSVGSYFGDTSINDGDHVPVLICAKKYENQAKKTRNTPQHHKKPVFVDLDFANKQMDALYAEIYPHRVGSMDVPFWYEFERSCRDVGVSYSYVPPPFLAEGTGAEIIPLSSSLSPPKSAESGASRGGPISASYAANGIVHTVNGIQTRQPSPSPSFRPASAVGVSTPTSLHRIASGTPDGLLHHRHGGGHSPRTSSALVLDRTGSCSLMSPPSPRASLSGHSVFSGNIATQQNSIKAEKNEQNATQFEANAQKSLLLQQRQKEVLGKYNIIPPTCVTAKALGANPNSPTAHKNNSTIGSSNSNKSSTTDPAFVLKLPLPIDLDAVFAPQ